MPKKQQLIHGTKSCGAEYSINYNEENIPYLECQGCGHRMEDWIKWETTYKYTYEQEHMWEDKKQHIVCLLGFFTNLYKKAYEVDFVFSLNDRGLFLGPECHLIRKIYKNFNSNVYVSKEYLEWIFFTKVQNKKKRITSLAFLATPAVIQEYALAKKKAQTISRSTPLPPKMIQWVDKFVPGIKEQVSLRDFGELHTLLTYYRDGHYAEDQDIAKLIQKLQTQKYITTDFEINNWRG